MIPIGETKEKYLGIPFKHRGRNPEEGLDCWGFIICVFKDLGFDLLDLENYDFKWSLSGKNYFIENYWKNWKRVKNPVVYDGLLFHNGKGVANHAGIYIGNDNFIHCCKAGVVIGKVTAPKWKNKLVGFFRFKKLEK